MRSKRRSIGLGIAFSAVLAAGFSEVLPDRVAESSRAVEEVRGRKFSRAVPATEIDAAEARRIIRAKLEEGLPASADDYLRSLSVLGLIDEVPGTLDRILDLYNSQVIAFYDPQPRRFFVVKGAAGGLGGELAEAAGLAESIVYAHELTHALQDDSLQLNERMRQLKDDSDRGFALQCLLEGEATLVMIKVALKDIPGADAHAEEELAPLLSAGSLERSNMPKDVPPYFVDQLFFPYVEGTAFVRAAFKKGGWPEVDRLWRSPPESSAEILHGSPYPPARAGPAAGGGRRALSRPAPRLYGHARRMDPAIPARARAARGRSGKGRHRMARRPDRVLRIRTHDGLPVAHPVRRGPLGRSLRNGIPKGEGETARHAGRGNRAGRPGRGDRLRIREGAGASIERPVRPVIPTRVPLPSRGVTSKGSLAPLRMTPVAQRSAATASAPSTRFFPARLAR